MMCFGVGVFVSGSARYNKLMPKGSALTTAVGIVYEALFVRYSVRSATDSLLDKANDQYGGSHSTNDVEGVKYVAKLAPFLGVMIPYWGIYGQTKTAFQIQGCQMQSKVGDLQLPISAMKMFNNVAILILVPLTDQVLYPYLKSRNINLSML
jgi:peptide/histidine transporter 3/4